MENARYRDLELFADDAAAALGPCADGNDQLRGEDFRQPRECLVAGLENSLSVFLLELLGCQVAATLVEEKEGAIVRHPEELEEAFGGPEMLSSPPPQALTADFLSPASEAEDGSFAMLDSWAADRDVAEPHPVANARNRTEWNTRLSHAPGTRIHADQKVPLGFAAEASYELGMNGCGIFERAIDEGHWRPEAAVRELGTEFSSDDGDRDARHYGRAARKLRPSDGIVTSVLPKMMSSGLR